MKEETVYKEIVESVLTYVNNWYNSKCTAAEALIDINKALDQIRSALFNPRIVKLNREFNKRIELRDKKGYIVACSPGFHPEGTITFQYRGYEYIQTGWKGEIYYRKVSEIG